MLYRLLLALLVLNSVILVAAILLQAGKGGGLAASFGGAGSGDQLFGTRQAGNLLTKTSWWGGGTFIFLSFVLSLMSAADGVPGSFLSDELQPPTAPAPRTLSPGDSGAPTGIPTQQAQPTPTPPTPPPQP
jgi:preprotein translocase subunit SecG